MLPLQITSPLIADYTGVDNQQFFVSTVYWQPIVDNLARPEAFTPSYQNVGKNQLLFDTN